MFLPLGFAALATRHDDYLMLVSTYVTLFFSPALWLGTIIFLRYVNVYRHRFFGYGVCLEVMASRFRMTL
jgi:hypothetical protein